MPPRSWAEVLRSPEVRAAVTRSERVQRVEHRREVGSTQDVLLELDDARGVMVVADVQRSGRGRHGRVWQDGPVPGASLATSVGLADRAEGLAVVPLAVGLAVRDAVRAAIVRALGAPTGAPDLTLRWPNDVLLGDAPARKCAGVLVERRTVADPASRARRTLLVVGIGIDVDWREAPVPADERGWTSLAEAVGARIDRPALLAALVDALDGWLDADPADVVAAHRAGSASLGREVVVTSPDGTRLAGWAVDVTDEGALVLEVDGARREVRAGVLEVVHPRATVASTRGAAHG